LLPVAPPSRSTLSNLRLNCPGREPLLRPLAQGHLPPLAGAAVGENAQARFTAQDDGTRTRQSKAPGVGYWGPGFRARPASFIASSSIVQFCSKYRVPAWTGCLSLDRGSCSPIGRKCTKATCQISASANAGNTPFRLRVGVYIPHDRRQLGTCGRRAYVFDRSASAVGTVPMWVLSPSPARSAPVATAVATAAI
jgi:hypothetical protein